MFEITLKPLDKLRKEVARIPEIADEASRFAVNDTADFAHAESSRRIRDQVAFKVSYLGTADGGGNLAVAKRATRGGDPEAILVGRMRPTSLMRFVQGTFQRGRPVRLRVSPGRLSSMSNAFPMKLRRGRGIYDPDNANEGLAIRLKKGESVRNKREMVQVSGNLYLLYGPSVDQVFRTVRADVAPAVSEHLERDFLRHYARLTRRG